MVTPLNAPYDPRPARRLSRRGGLANQSKETGTMQAPELLKQSAPRWRLDRPHAATIALVILGAALIGVVFLLLTSGAPQALASSLSRST